MSDIFSKDFCVEPRGEAEQDYLDEIRAENAAEEALMAKLENDPRMYPGEENTPYYDGNLAFPNGVKLPPIRHTRSLPPPPAIDPVTRFRLAAAFRQATQNSEPFPPSGGDR